MDVCQYRHITVQHSAMW